MKHRDGMTRLDDFGVVDDARERFKSYVTAAGKLSPKDRAAWWRDVFERDPESLKFFRGDELK
ncbi:hypothetical protein E2P63_09085 [Candidatus Bathyarchaeota archaeon]|nr:hypothetical protein E2P63_09085 [Candidatus Bathyarchaeota archaeon]